MPIPKITGVDTVKYAPRSLIEADLIQTNAKEANTFNKQIIPIKFVFQDVPKKDCMFIFFILLKSLVSQLPLSSSEDSSTTEGSGANDEFSADSLTSSLGSTSTEGSEI